MFGRWVTPDEALVNLAVLTAERTDQSMRRFTRLLVLALCVSAAAVAQSRESPSGKYGAPLTDAWTCPVTHPIKGNFTTYSGERCIYRLPGGLRDVEGVPTGRPE